MPAFLTNCSGYVLKVKDADTDPPHCHAHGEHFPEEEIGLYDLKPLRGTKPQIRIRALRDCLERHQEDMLRAWDKVRVIDP